MKSIYQLLLAAGAVSAETNQSINLEIFDFIKAENVVQSLIESV